uniref:Uncharacterized protein n=1 Tax=Arundo donax TaxID=35708 RepID=A0A0A8ZPU1_ARUDO
MIDRFTLLDTSSALTAKESVANNGSLSGQRRFNTENCFRVRRAWLILLRSHRRRRKAPLKVGLSRQWDLVV